MIKKHCACCNIKKDCLEIKSTIYPIYCLCSKCLKRNYNTVILNIDKNSLIEVNNILGINKDV